MLCGIDESDCHLRRLTRDQVCRSCKHGSGKRDESDGFGKHFDAELVLVYGFEVGKDCGDCLDDCILLIMLLVIVL